MRDQEPQGQSARSDDAFFSRQQQILAKAAARRLENVRTSNSDKDEGSEALDLSSDLSEPLLGGTRRLAELLSHDELARLLGSDLLNGFRSLASTALGRTPKLSKASLSAGLLLVHGADLFTYKPVRDAIAKQLKIVGPSRWVPGKARALQFIHEAGFNKVFAGTPAERAPDDVEWLEGRTALPPLADFQKEVLEKSEQELGDRRKHPRVIVTLPTGGGKTRVASEYLSRFLGKRPINEPFPVALWVAHTEELLEQAVEALRQVWGEAANAPTLRLDRRFGNHGRSEGADEELLSTLNEPQVLVATPQRMLNDFKRWDESYAEEFETWLARVRLVVIDEAHRAAAPQYKTLIEMFEQRSKHLGQPEPRILGLTATPFRVEYHQSYPELGTRELFKLFRRIVEPNQTLGEHPRDALQARQVLAMPVETRIETRRNLKVADLVSANSGLENQALLMESIDRRLMDQADDANRRAIVFRHLLSICQEPGNRVLYFGPSVTDAGIVAFMLRAQGVPAAFVSGITRRPERRRTVTDFREGRVRVLCNCEVLTTGFDAPKVTHVIIARPTVSHVLFEQMVGRGLRGPQFGGTEQCHVLYYVDNIDIDQPRMGFRAWRVIWGLEKVSET